MRISQVQGLPKVLNMSWIPEVPLFEVDVTYGGPETKVIILNNSSSSIEYNYYGEIKEAIGLNSTVTVLASAKDATQYRGVLLSYNVLTDQVTLTESTLYASLELIPSIAIPLTNIKIGTMVLTPIGQENIISIIDQIDYDKAQIDTLLPNIVPDITPQEVDATNQLGAILKGIDNVLEDIVYIEGIQEIIGKKVFKTDLPFEQRFWGKPSIVPSANILAADTNFIQLTTNTEELQLYDSYLNVDYIGASVVIIYAQVDQVFKHNYPSVDDRYIPYYLAQESDITLESQRPVLFYSLCDSSGRAIALVQIAETISIENTFPAVYQAIAAQMYGYNFATTFKVFGDFSTVDTDITKGATNEGTATIVDIQSIYIELSSGTFFGLKTFNISAVQVNEIVGCENSINEPELHCGIIGNQFLVAETKTSILQDDYKYVQMYGTQDITTENGNNMTVPLKTDLTKIYN